MPYEELPRGKQNWYIQNGGLWQPVTLEIRAGASTSNACSVTAQDRRRAVEVDVDIAGGPHRPRRDAEGGRARPRRTRRGDAAGCPRDWTWPRSRSRQRSTSPRLWSPQDPALYYRRGRRWPARIADRAGRSLRLPRVHRARRPVLPQRPAVLHAWRARSGLLRRLNLLDARQGLCRGHDAEGPVARPERAALPHQGVRSRLSRRRRRSRACSCGTRCRAGIGGRRLRSRAAGRRSTTWSTRDWNHPSIVIQSLINEAWGIDMKQGRPARRPASVVRRGARRASRRSGA